MLPELSHIDDDPTLACVASTLHGVESMEEVFVEKDEEKAYHIPHIPQWQVVLEEQRRRFLKRRSMRRLLSVGLRLLGALPLAICAAVIILALLRFFVVLLETFDVIRGERRADEELMTLCAEGAAMASPRMQTTCMEASAAQASPVVITAIVRASFAFIDEMWGLVASPLHSLSIASAVGALGVLPWLSTIRTFFWPFASSVAATTPNDPGRQHVIVLHNGSIQPHLTEGLLSMRGSRSPSISRIAAPPSLQECNAEPLDSLGWNPLPMRRENWHLKTA